MSVHLVKLCVGIDAIDALARWQRQRLAANTKEIGRPLLFHKTRMVPKRQNELLEAGSIYWVIRGVIQVRQRIVGFETGQLDDGAKCCLIFLAPELVAVHPTPRRSFQGWRYLDAGDAPPDIDATAKDDLLAMPQTMRRELAELCLL